MLSFQHEKTLGQSNLCKKKKKKEKEKKKKKNEKDKQS